MMRRGKDSEKHTKSGRRGERLAAALRENLRRRKARQRGRSASELLANSTPPARGDKSR